MPFHGLKLDLEFAAITLGAVVFSYFITDQLVSNTLFSALIAVLFFLTGLHLDISRTKKNLHKGKELGVGLGMVYILVPSLAFLISEVVGGSIGQSMIAIGVSTAAIGAPVVWSNIGKGDGETALLISTLSLFTGIVAIPALLIGMGQGVAVLDLIVENIAFVGVPLLLGIASQRFENFLFSDMKHHFSKLALWLILLIMAVQFHLIYRNEGLGFLNDIGYGIIVYTLFTLVSFGMGYYISRDLGIMERKARAIGFVSGSKGISVALFIAAQLSGRAVLGVSVYFFVRQIVCGGISEYFSNDGDLKALASSLKKW